MNAQNDLWPKLSIERLQFKAICVLVAVHQEMWMHPFDVIVYHASIWGPVYNFDVISPIKLLHFCSQCLQQFSLFDWHKFSFCKSLFNSFLFLFLALPFRICDIWYCFYCICFFVIFHCQSNVFQACDFSGFFPISGFFTILLCLRIFLKEEKLPPRKNRSSLYCFQTLSFLFVGM